MVGHVRLVDPVGMVNFLRGRLLGVVLMVPWVRTAEYTLLQYLAERVEVTVSYPKNQAALNQLALTKAIDAGYVERDGDLIWITDAGLDRLDELDG